MEVLGVVSEYDLMARVGKREIERYASGVRVRDDAARDDASCDAFVRAFERVVRANGDAARVVRG
jgi:hypothetical protein